VIEMQRKLPDEKADDFAHTDDEQLSQLRQQFARFANDNVGRLQKSSPHMPAGFANRLAANWRLMLGIAELCGPQMAERARAAAVALSGRTDQVSLGVELLRDIRDIRDDLAPRDIDRIRSEELVKKLGEMDDRPWPETPFTGKPITQAQLARLLKPYGVRPKQVRFGERTFKGYEFGWFETAFRYVRSPSPLKPETPETTAAFSPEYRNKTQNMFRLAPETVSASVSAKMPESDQCFGVSPSHGGNVDRSPLTCLKDASLQLKLAPVGEEAQQGKTQQGSTHSAAHETEEQRQNLASAADVADAAYDFEERAAILEYDGGFTRAEAEAQVAREMPDLPAFLDRRAARARDK
jgi:hypothetical protein